VTDTPTVAGSESTVRVPPASSKALRMTFDRGELKTVMPAPSSDCPSLSVTAMTRVPAPVVGAPAIGKLPAAGIEEPEPPPHPLTVTTARQKIAIMA
jgi:hypothetical protein